MTNKLSSFIDSIVDKRNEAITDFVVFASHHPWVQAFNNLVDQWVGNSFNQPIELSIHDQDLDPADKRPY